MSTDAGDRKQNANYFRFAGFFWLSLILFGMTTTYLFAYVIPPILMESNSAMTVDTFLQSINYYIVKAFGSRVVLDYIFKAAVGAHLLEGVIALILSIEMGCYNTCILWMLQTVIYGYPSLPEVLICGPKFTGCPQSLDLASNVLIQMSFPP